MKRIASLLTVSLCIMVSLTCCNRQENETSGILDKAEECLEQYPDSSMAILNTLKIGQIQNKANRARYALLKSIALDKNYIDVTDDSLTSIAVSYYKKHGTADERLKAYLYNGRVYHNAKDYERAMNDFLQAEKSVKSCKNNIIIGRLYNSKALIYNTIFDGRSAIEQLGLASKYFLKGGDTVRFLNNLNNTAIIMRNSSLLDSVALADYKNQMERYWERLTPSQKDNYYFIQLEMIPKTDTVAINLMINKYLNSNLGEDNISWLSIANAYLKVGNIEESLKSVKKHKLDGSITDATYYSILSKIYSKNGEYEQAYNFLSKSKELTSDRYYRTVKSDTKFLEERYDAKAQDVKQKHLILFLVMGIVIIILVLFLLKKHYKNVSLEHQMKLLALEEESKRQQQELECLAAEKENYQLKCRDAIKEQEELKSIIEQGRSNITLNPDILQLLTQRLAILDKFIAANISTAFSKEALEELDQLMQDRASFLESTRISFALSHPKFIEHLYEKGLTDKEVSCCCLYCMGLNGSEISNYLEMKSFYNFSKVIRRKLSLNRSMNIDTYLRILLEQLEK